MEYLKNHYKSCTGNCCSWCTAPRRIDKELGNSKEQIIDALVKGACGAIAHYKSTEESSYFDIKIFDWYGNLLHHIKESASIDSPFTYSREKLHMELYDKLNEYKIKQAYRRFTGYRDESMEAEIWVVKSK